MPTPEIYSARQLYAQARTFPPVQWVVESILPEGLSLCISKAKTGKTFLIMAVAIAAASGGAVLGQHWSPIGDVLYLDLDQRHRRRTYRRLKGMLRDEPPPDRLSFANEWPRFTGEKDCGIVQIEVWVQAASNPRLVVIDTAASVWPRKLGGPQTNAYYAEYELLDRVRRVASAAPGLGVMVVHHESKGDKADALDKPSGTTAWGGAADCIWILKRDRGENGATLYVTGKEVEEQTVPLTFDPHLGGWNRQGGNELEERSTWWNRER